MKCKGCGAAYDPQLAFCPYCGLENAQLKKRQEAVQKKQAQYERKKKQVLTESASEMRLQKINRLMWIVAGLTGFFFILMFVFFLVQDKVESWFNKPEQVYLEELREAGHWEAMQSYLYDTYPDEDTYDLYWQLALLAEDGEDLRYYRSEYTTLDKEQYRAAFLGSSQLDSYDVDYYQDHYVFLVERLLNDCRDILSLREEYTGDSWRAEQYGPLTKEGDQLLAEYELEAKITLSMILKLEASEVEALLKETYLDDATAKNYVDRIREDWLYE